jgi:hypothetical protein
MGCDLIMQNTVGDGREGRKHHYFQEFHATA